MTNAVIEVSDDEMMALGARIRAYAGIASVGPPAIAASSPESLERARLFAALADAPAGRQRSSASCTLRASGRTTQAPVKSS